MNKSTEKVSDPFNYSHSYKLKIAVSILWIFVAGNISNATTIVVPSETNIVQQANLIISGIVDFDDANRSLLRVDKVFKGDLAAKDAIELQLEEPIFGFSLEDFLKPYQGKKVIVSGKYNQAEQIIILPWYISSIWPYGTKEQKGQLFSSETYEQCEEFLVSLLAYQEMGTVDKDALIIQLLNDIRIPNKRYAVLCYSDEMLSKALADKELKKQFHAALMAEIITNDIKDPITVNNIVSLSPQLPPSLCAAYLLNVSMQKSNESSERAFKSAKAILRTRHIIEKDEVEDPNHLELIMTERIGQMRISDAKDAMKMYESKNQRLKESAGNIIRLALSDKRQITGSIEEQKEFWEQEIKKKYDAIDSEKIQNREN